MILAPVSGLLLPFCYHSTAKRPFLHLFNDRRRYGFVQAVHRVFVPRRKPLPVSIDGHFDRGMPQLPLDVRRRLAVLEQLRREGMAEGMRAEVRRQLACTVGVRAGLCWPYLFSRRDSRTPRQGRDTFCVRDKDRREAADEISLYAECEGQRK